MTVHDALAGHGGVAVDLDGQHVERAAVLYRQPFQHVRSWRGRCPITDQRLPGGRVGGQVDRVSLPLSEGEHTSSRPAGGTSHRRLR